MSRSLPGARVRLDRRALLRRTGALAALAAVPLVATATAAAGTATASTAAVEPEGPECLADLIDEGVVKRADLLA